MEELLKQFPNVELHQEPYENKLSHYWYGGAVATIHVSEKITFEVWANGDIRAELFSSPDEVEVYVKDKCNNGNFYHEMSAHIQDDEQLFEYITNEAEDKYPLLVIDNNNWWELFVYENGEFVDSFVLEADILPEALAESMLYVEDYEKPAS